MFSISKSTTGGQEMYWGGLEWLVLAGGQIEKSEWNGKRQLLCLALPSLPLSSSPSSTVLKNKVILTQSVPDSNELVYDLES